MGVKWGMGDGRWSIELFLFPFFFFLLLSCSNTNDWVNTLPKPWTLSESQVSEILPQFHQKFPDFHDRLKAFAQWQVGKPYEIFKLGEEVAPDPDPIIRLDVSDCTAHILTSLAFSQSISWDEAKESMITIHYKDGNPTYKTRWHYTTDRIQENSSTVNITNELVGVEQLESVEIILNRKEDGKEFLDLGWEKSTSIQYIPSNNITQEILQKLPHVSGVAFVKKTYFKMGLVVAHEGMIIDQKNIIHASSEYDKTVNIDFMDYYFRENGPLFDGVLFYSFHPMKE
ncbi:MAG: N-acetylmuramoyl-L-alanine amidase-like domain-containing protein [bacterium]